MSNSVKTDGWGGIASIVKEPVLVLWRDEDNVEQYFGCLHKAGHEDVDCNGNYNNEGGDREAKDEHAGCIGNLDLEIHKGEGADPTAMVKFHLPVRIGNKAKSPKHMYIVIPTSGLSMTRNLESTVPQNIGKHIPVLPCNCMHLELSDTKAAYAIMPEVQRQPGQVGRPLTGIAKQLMIYLKSLCNAKSLDVFLMGNSAVQDQIDATCRLLNEGHVSEPAIDLRSIYPDGVCGRIGNWLDYSCEENGPAIPPPYDQIAPRLPQFPCTASSETSGSELELHWRASPGPSSPARSHEDDTVEVAVGAASTKRKETAEAGRGTYKRPCMTTSISGSLAAWHRQLDVVREDVASELSPTQANTDPPAPLYDEGPAVVLTEKSKGDGVSTDNCPSNDAVSDPTLPPTSPPAAATGVPRFQPECHAGPGTLYFMMAEFLLYCLKIDPSAPTRYKTKLQQMADHVYQRDEAAFHGAKRACLIDLCCRRNAGYELLMEPDPAPLAEQIEKLYVWLDTELCKETYLYTGCHFANLQGVVTREMETRYRWRGDLREKFEIHKADLYAAAFWTANALRMGSAIPPPVLCVDCFARLAWLYPSFK